MKINIERVEQTIKNHEIWLDKNNNAYGQGFDPYVLNKKLHYPEAYGKYLSSFSKLAKINNNKKQIKKSATCYAWLLENQSKKEPFAWGLPFKWDSCPANEPFLLTTANIASSIIDYYNITKDEKVLLNAKKSLKYIQKLHNQTTEKTNYSGFFQFNYYIPNAAAISLIYLSKIMSSKKAQQIGKDIVEILFLVQNKDGSWKYSEKNPYIDTVHTAYTLEGLWTYYYKTKNKNYLKKIILGTNYMCKHFFQKKTGKVEWAKLYSFKDWKTKEYKRIIKDIIIKTANKLGLLKKYHPEAELWGYAACIRMLILASKYDAKYKHYLYKISSYVLHHLINENGTFKYRCNDQRVFIRHQAHMFEALTELLLFLKAEKNEK